MTVIPTQRPEPYDYDSALRRRLAIVSDIGTQQNNAVVQQAAARRQSRMASLQQQGQQGSVQTPAGDVSGTLSNTGFVPSRNPRSAQEAIAWAKQAAASGDSQWYRRCLAFVAQAYGLKASGTPYAIDAYNRLPASQRGSGYNAPGGSLMFWNTGQRAGHVALYLGNGLIASNDIGGRGRISIVPVGDISKKWGSKYVGWSLPNFAATPR